MKTQNEEFKNWWLKIHDCEPSEKICTYYQKGVETGKEELKQQRPILVVERFFLQAIKEVNKEFFPTQEDVDYCLQAFSKGCSQAFSKGCSQA